MAILIEMPKLSDTMEEGIILKWRKKEGDEIKQGEILVDIQSDKADMELDAFESGVIRKIFVEEGKGVKIGERIAIIGLKDEDISDLLSRVKKIVTKEEKKVIDKNIEPERKTSPHETKISSGRIKATPLAKKIAKDNRIDLAYLKGSGPNGRIIKQDVSEQMRSGIGSIQIGKGKSVPISLMRKTIAKRLVESKNQAPHFYLTASIKMDSAFKSREEFNSSKNKKISFTDIIVKAIATCLKKHQKVNSVWNVDSIIQNEEINIGVAVAIEDGLITPVVKNCDQKNILEISDEIKILAAKAKEKKLKPEEFQGNSFTISNLGMFDIDNFTAIINPPDSAILAVGAINEIPVVEDGKITIAKIMKVTLSCDHRVIDGAVGAQFLQSLKEILEKEIVINSNE